jgi:hypothetical protein
MTVILAAKDRHNRKDTEQNSAFSYLHTRVREGGRQARRRMLSVPRPRQEAAGPEDEGTWQNQTTRVPGPSEPYLVIIMRVNNKINLW